MFHWFCNSAESDKSEPLVIGSHCIRRRVWVLVIQPRCLPPGISQAWCWSWDVVTNKVKKVALTFQVPWGGGRLKRNLGILGSCLTENKLWKNACRLTLKDGTLAFEKGACFCKSPFFLLSFHPALLKHQVQKALGIQLYEYTKSHWIRHFVWMGCMICEFYLNKTVKKVICCIWVF